jgi:hypothetical protein
MNGSRTRVIRKGNNMAFGDFGGPVTSLIITCRAADNNGTVAIKKGDALKLVDNYTG